MPSSLLFFFYFLLIAIPWALMLETGADHSPIASADPGPPQRKENEQTKPKEMEKHQQQGEGQGGGKPPTPSSHPHPHPHQQDLPLPSPPSPSSLLHQGPHGHRHHLIVTVGLIVHRSAPLRFLLARRGRPPFLGQWSLIGGIGAFDDDPDPMRAVSLEVLADVSTPLLDPKFLTYSYTPPSPLDGDSSTATSTATSTPSIAAMHRRGTIALAFYGHVEEDRVEVNTLYALEAKWFTAEEALAIPDLAFKEQRFLESFLEKFHPSYLNATVSTALSASPSCSVANGDAIVAIQPEVDNGKKKNRPHAVLFDLDGTLVNNEEAVTICYMRVAEKLGYTAITREDFHRVKGLSCPITMASVGIAPEHISQDIYFKELPDCFSHVKPFPAAQPLLEFLKKAGIPIAIVTTNYHNMAVTILDMCNLSQYVDVVFGQDDVARPKPDPACVVLACWKLKQTPSTQILFVGDSLTDMEAATAAGVSAILVNNPSAEARKLSDKAFDNLDQVKAWMLSEIK